MMHSGENAHARLALAEGLSASELEIFNRAAVSRSVGGGRPVYRARDPFHGLFLLTEGLVITRAMSREGNERITGLHAAGEVLGFDGLGTGDYAYDAMALVDSTVLAVSEASLERLGREIPAFDRNLRRELGRTLLRRDGLMAVLGGRADARIAAVLLGLARSTAPGGPLKCEFRLPMSRAELGSLVGLRLETVSRELTHLKRLGLIALRGKRVLLRDPARLRAMAGEACSAFGFDAVDEARIEAGDAEPARSPQMRPTETQVAI
jgi:CRP/FNR family transcriptional regulator